MDIADRGGGGDGKAVEQTELRTFVEAARLDVFVHFNLEATIAQLRLAFTNLLTTEVFAAEILGPDHLADHTQH